MASLQLAGMRMWLREKIFLLIIFAFATGGTSPHVRLHVHDLIGIGILSCQNARIRRIVRRWLVHFLLVVVFGFATGGPSPHVRLHDDCLIGVGIISATCR